MAHVSKCWWLSAHFMLLFVKMIGFSYWVARELFSQNCLWSCKFFETRMQQVALGFFLQVCALHLIPLHIFSMHIFLQFARIARYKLTGAELLSVFYLRRVLAVYNIASLKNFCLFSPTYLWCTDLSGLQFPICQMVVRWSNIELLSVFMGSLQCSLHWAFSFPIRRKDPTCFLVIPQSVEH